jgi:formyl-CoA transferase
MPFAMLNACKDSISLNLKSDKGREIFLRLVETADVVAENFAPGTMDRLGIGWEVLKDMNPRLIMASGSGYGQDGAYRDLMAMDITVQAMSGLMSVTGEPDGPPMKTGAAVCDFGGGIHMYGAIMTALFERMSTGKGNRIDIAMIDSTYMMMASNIGMQYGTRRDEILLRTGNQHGGLSLCPYSVYEASDGYVAIICNSERHWASLAHCMDRPDLIDDDRTRHNRDRVANMEMVDGLIRAFAASHTTESLSALLRERKVPSAPVRPLPDVMSDEALHDRGLLHRIDHPDFGVVSLPRSPLRLGGAKQADYRVSPTLARDNARIFGELGFDVAELENLRREGVV